MFRTHHSSQFLVKKRNFWLDKDWRHFIPSVSGGAPGKCIQKPSRPIPLQPSVQEGFNCKVLAGGDAGQEQLREEPVGIQLNSLAPGSLQLVARLLGEEESILPSLFSHILLIPPTPPPPLPWTRTLSKHFKQCRGNHYLKNFVKIIITNKCLHLEEHLNPAQGGHQYLGL